MSNVTAMPNFIPAPIGRRRNNTPELRESLRKGTIADVRDKLAEHSRISAKTWVYVGKSLAETKELADQDGPKVFAGLFATSAKQAVETSRFPFSLQTAYKLIAVAETFAHWAKTDSLPASWRTLYELSRLPPDRLSAAIDSGEVHPMMTRAEAVKLSGKKKVAKKKAKKLSKKEAEEESYDTVKRWFSRFKEPKVQGVEILNLLNDLGWTLEQLQEIEH
jgi:hypothetical protein